MDSVTKREIVPGMLWLFDGSLRAENASVEVIVGRVDNGPYRRMALLGPVRGCETISVPPYTIRDCPKDKRDWDRGGICSLWTDGATLLLPW